MISTPDIKRHDKDKPYPGYDTVNIWIPDKSCDTSKLTNKRTIYKDGSLVYIEGRLGNLKIYSSDRGTSIQNSLATFIYGNNCFGLDEYSTLIAFDLLTKNLRIPIEKGKVKRLDFGMNIFTTNPPELYYRYLGSCKYFHRIAQPKGVYYQNRNRQLCFYDKVSQMKKEQLPKEWLGRNVLRIELRLQSGFLKTISPAITCESLVEINFINYMKESFVNCFNAVQKVNVDFSNITLAQDSTCDDVLRLFAKVGIQHFGGVVAVHQFIEQNKFKFKRREYASRIKKEINKLYTDQSCHTDPINSISELNNKVSSIL